uniref:LRR containing protein n=1 Tax=Trichogramma kaykai TaxID=54128 RepID=A0ABD2WZN9_9HYME
MQSALLTVDHKISFPILFNEDQPVYTLFIKNLFGNFKIPQIQEFLMPVDPSEYRLTAIKYNSNRKCTPGKINCYSLTVSCKIQAMAAANLFKWSYVDKNGNTQRGFIKVEPLGNKIFSKTLNVIQPPKAYSKQTLQSPLVSHYTVTMKIFENLDIRTAFNIVMAYALHPTLVNALFTYFFDSSWPIPFGQTSFDSLTSQFNKYEPHTLIFDTPNNINSVILVRECLNKIRDNPLCRRDGAKGHLRCLDVTTVEMTQQCLEFISNNFKIDTFRLGRTLSVTEKIICKMNITDLIIVNNPKFRGECLQNEHLQKVTIRNCANLRLCLLSKALINNYTISNLEIINMFATDFYEGSVQLFEQLFSDRNALERITVKFDKPNVRLVNPDFNPQTHVSSKIKYLDLSNAVFVESVIDQIVQRIPNVTVLKLENIQLNDNVDFSRLYNLRFLTIKFNINKPQILDRLPKSLISITLSYAKADPRQFNFETVRKLLHQKIQICCRGFNIIEPHWMQELFKKGTLFHSTCGENYFVRKVTVKPVIKTPSCST